MNVIMQTYNLSENATLQITLRSPRVLTGKEVEAYGIIAAAAEQLVHNGQNRVISFPDEATQS